MSSEADSSRLVFRGATTIFGTLSQASWPLGRLTLTAEYVRIDTVLPRPLEVLFLQVTDRLVRERVHSLTVQSRSTGAALSGQSQWWVRRLDGSFSRVGFTTLDGVRVLDGCAQMGYSVHRCGGWGEPWREM